jgi:hypothetical protein
VQLKATIWVTFKCGQRCALSRNREAHSYIQVPLRLHSDAGSPMRRATRSTASSLAQVRQGGAAAGCLCRRFNHRPELNGILDPAGVVGLACARAIAQAGHEVLVVERAGAIGTETSSRRVCSEPPVYVPWSRPDCQTLTNRAAAAGRVPEKQCPGPALSTGRLASSAHIWAASSQPRRQELRSDPCGDILPARQPQGDHMRGGSRHAV